MIKDLKFTGTPLGDYSDLEISEIIFQHENFLCEADWYGRKVQISITACCVSKVLNDSGGFILIPCTSNYKFILEGELTVEDLAPLWKKTVRRLKEKIKKQDDFPANKDFVYPPSDMMNKSVELFLAEWNKANSDENGSGDAA